MNIYVANKGEDTVQRINLNKHINDFLRLKPLKEMYNVLQYNREPVVGPHRMIFDKVSKKLYTLNEYDDSISIIDINSFKFLRTIYAGACPNNGIILNNDILITNGDGDCVSVFNIKSEKIVEQIKVGSQPQAILYNKRFGKIIVCNMNSDSITIINPLDFSVEKDFVVGSKPYDMCFSNDEKYLFVSNTYLESGLDGTISIFDMSSEKIVNTLKCGKLPISICSDEKYIYVVNSCSNTLRRICIKTGEYKEIYCGYMPSYITVKNRKAFISNTGENKLLLIDIENFLVEKSIEMGKEPDGIFIET